MRQSLVGKAIAAITSGALFGLYVHNDYATWGARGREAFLAHQAHRFDQYMAVPRPTMLTVFGSTIVIVGALALYEGLASLFSRIANSLSGGQSQL